MGALLADARRLVLRLSMRSEQTARYWIGPVLLGGPRTLPRVDDTMPSIEVTQPTDTGTNTFNALAQLKWLCLIILTAIATWRVVALGIAWSGGNPTGTRQAFVGLVGVLIAIYLLFNITSVYNIISDLIPL